ncbi:hypothetical protein BD770DRAFT_204697 [Pilaira anomala]|nr:hypothetical protein BD770DRAFT_204697 [Pilaira anomala]
MQPTISLPQDVSLSEKDLKAVAGTNRLHLLRVQAKNDNRWADKMRNRLQVHEYLCHIGEAIDKM